MVELLVVAAVIAILLSLVTAVGGKLIYSQKRRNTEQIMQNVSLALEQFATEAPLRSIYNVNGGETFGKYPPYQLANFDVDLNTVAQTLERSHPLVTTGIPSVPLSLPERLSRDMSGVAANQGVVDANYVVINTPNGPINPGYTDGLDDARALYTYLKVFSPASLDLIPAEYIKPLYPQATSNQRGYVNTLGTPFIPGEYDVNANVEDILAIHDAWGVPLDYMLYAKCEYMLPEGGAAADLGFFVTERRPVLRSLGLKREVYDVEVAAIDDPAMRRFDYSKWIFSEALASPVAGLNDPGSPDNSEFRAGNLPNPPPNPVSSANGWTRVVGVGESYSYLPAGDKKWQQGP